MKNQVLEFISKVYVEGKSRYPIARVGIRILLGIYILIILISIWAGVFSTNDITPNLFPIALLVYTMNRTKKVSGYKATVVRVELKDNEITICYEGLDRDDKMGPRVEKTTILYNNITNMEYSIPIQCLNIQGFPVESTQYLRQSSKNEVVVNYCDKKMEKRTLLYVGNREKEKIINFLEAKTGKKTSFLN